MPPNLQFKSINFKLNILQFQWEYKRSSFYFIAVKSRAVNDSWADQQSSQISGFKLINEPLNCL